MKDNMIRLFLLVTILFSCNKNVNQKKTLSANTGKQNEIILIMDDKKPVVYRNGRRNTKLMIPAISIAAFEYRACLPGLCDGSAYQVSLASSSNQMVISPRLESA